MFVVRKQLRPLELLRIIMGMLPANTSLQTTFHLQYLCFLVVVIGENQPGQSGQTEIHLQEASGYSEKVQYVLKTKLLL